MHRINTYMMNLLRKYESFNKDEMFSAGTAIFFSFFSSFFLQNLRVIICVLLDKHSFKQL